MCVSTDIQIIDLIGSDFSLSVWDGGKMCLIHSWWKICFMSTDINSSEHRAANLV